MTETTRGAHSLIERVKPKLPKDVQDFLMNNVIILTWEPEALGMAFTKEEMEELYKSEKHIILLNEKLFEMPSDHSEFVLTHEIAHLYLRQTTIFDKHMKKNEIDRLMREVEEAASELARKWLGASGK